MENSKKIAVHLYQLSKKKGVYSKNDKKTISETTTVLSRAYVEHFNAGWKTRGKIYEAATKAYYATTQGKNQAGVELMNANNSDSSKKPIRSVKDAKKKLKAKK